MPGGIWAKGPKSSVTVVSRAFEARGLPRALLVDYVPRRITALLCPTPLCGQYEDPATNAGWSLRGWPDDFQRAFSHFSSSASFRQTERAGQAAEGSATGGWQASDAFGFIRSLIPA